MELVGRVDGTCGLQQLQWCFLCAAAGFDYGLVLGRVLVGLEQNLVQLLANRLGASASGQFLGPAINLCLDLLFLFNGGQCLLQDFSGRFAETALASAAEIVGCAIQRKQHADLLGVGGAVREVVARQIGKAKFFFGGKFPGQVQLDGGGNGLGFGHQDGRLGLFKLEQDVGGLDLDALARGQLDLGGGIGLRQDTAGQKLTGIFKQCVHRAVIVPRCRFPPSAARLEKCSVECVLLKKELPALVMPWFPYVLYVKPLSIKR